MISIPYSRSNGQFTFTDSLILEDEVYAAMALEDVIAMQDARFAAWLSHVEEASNAPVEEVTNG